ncbi:uncharacterized protein [Miscanthus floridulus]|uniref:uncharacterized protein n=1 Tax=Miscanthus floridulus TaxID=154761 RepID=UPI00345832F8
MQTMHQHYHPSGSKKAPAAAATAPLPAAVKDGASLVVKVYRRQGDRPVAAACRREAATAVVAAESAAVDVCLAAAAMAGAALLAWWAVAFHPSYAQLWMVPLGLVLAGTPPVVCLALRFSSNSRAPATPGKGPSGCAGAPPLVAVVVDK